MISRILLVVLAAALSLPIGTSQHPDHEYHHLCTLIALPWDSNTRVPPPELPVVAARGGATFSVTYNGFTPQAQAAFQRAVDIWAGLVASPRPIRITATFSVLNPGVLGSAGASCHHSGFANQPVPGTWYPNALADAFSGSDIAGCSAANANFEVSASFSSTANWYFGLDGRPGSGQFDFVSVVLHEIGHGLGFAGLADVDAGQGTIVPSGLPSIYSRHAVTENGTPLTSFVSPSAALGTQLTHNYSAANPRGPGVYFSGTHTNAANGGLSARLYTVDPWRAGSSYSHLNEATYPAGHADSLMTFAIGSAEAIHHPGNVTLGMFKDMGWSTCPASLAETTIAVGSAAGNGSVSLFIEPGCIWAATSFSPFLTITSASSGTGNSTVTYSYTANTTGAPRQGTLRISGVTYTVMQGESAAAPVVPTLRGTPSTLRFAATKNGSGGELVAVTGAQGVTVSHTGSTAPQWTATSNQPWAVVSNGSGTGAGTFVVSIANPGNVIGGLTSLSATITLTAANTGASTTIAVQLSVTPQTGTTSAPVGQVDTPSQNTSGAQGAIPMTGWVVDDIGVAHVQIYRQCLSVDVSGACGQVLGQQLVLLGTASVIAGARPDVEAQYPTLPAANSAGWGFLILSNLLPNIPASNASGGGVGTFQLYAVATDMEGNQRLLGRTVSDTTPTTVTVANDTIAKPFGAIDTPAQGATVSGTLNNFGWVLTPDSNMVPDATDILVPTAGTTITVFIDGAPVGTATYNLCRGSVAVDGVTPTGLLCDDDVSSIFRGAGRYRNLDAGRGPIALRTISTTALTNGLHTIQWGVTDSASRGEGIGSRYFTVLNSASKAAGRTEQTDFSPSDVRRAALDAARAGEARRLRELPVAALVVYGRTGFNERQAFVPVTSVDGVPTIVVSEMGRVELQIPGATHVALLANGSLRDAPVGMSVDEDAGMVRWSVGPGYLGTYRLSVERADDRVLVDVTVAPALSESGGRVEGVRMHLDRADVYGVVFTLHGWALDPQADTGSGIGAVHIWARPKMSSEAIVGTIASELVFLGTADLGIARPDVAAAHGARFTHTGFAFQGALAPGDWEVTAYIWNHRTGRFEDARSVLVTAK